MSILRTPLVLLQSADEHRRDLKTVKEEHAKVPIWLAGYCVDFLICLRNVFGSCVTCSSNVATLAVLVTNAQPCFNTAQTLTGAQSASKQAEQRVSELEELLNQQSQKTIQVQPSAADFPAPASGG